MFTGIIECLGIVKAVELQSTNKIFTIESAISSNLKVDQSVSHNGVCLTVTSVEEDSHTVVAVNETLQVSNLDSVKVNDRFNL